MTREQKIKKIGVNIQKQIDALKVLNCSLDASTGIHIFDNEIEIPELRIRVEGVGGDCEDQIVYSFNTSG